MFNEHTKEETSGQLSGIGKHRRITQALFSVLILLAIFLAAKTISEIKGYAFIGGGVPVSNTVTVSGTGEVFAVPDIATFTLSVVEQKLTVDEAQTVATNKINAIFAYLKENNIADTDIKTVNYSVNPLYEYRQEACTSMRCPPGKSVLTGYEVNQTLSVKVRNTKNAGTLLSGVGKLGVSNVSGLSFTIDDEDTLQAQARKVAIADAKEKAEQLAKDLDVRLVRIINFNEQGGPYPIYYAGVEAYGKGGDVSSVPQTPAGENKITSIVNITYEIR